MKRKLNILIICSFFPPDTSIAAVRPFMFAKYLLKNGHKVTVLRSGKFSLMPDKSFGGYPEGLKIINALGSDSPVARYEANKEGYNYSLTKKMGWLNYGLRETIRVAYYKYGAEIINLKRLREAKKIFDRQKQCIDQLPGNFDIVFSTYGNMENVYAGIYASRRLKCKWILDLRDVLTTPYRELTWNIPVKKIERRALAECDACVTISHGLSDGIYRKTGRKAVTIYNGYDGENVRNEDGAQQTSLYPDQLVFCYTGSIYNERIASLVWFCKRLSEVIRSGRAKAGQFRLVYAGGHGGLARKELKRFGIESIFDDRGYLSRKEIYDLQNESDLFLLLSANTKKYKGVMTGKFYEGIRSKRPILCVVSGDEPGSELAEINRRYKYGFCCECMTNGADRAFREYVLKALREKQENGQVEYTPGEGLFNKFQYSTLTKELEELMYQVMGR